MKRPRCGPASLATWLIEQVREIEEESDALQRQDVLTLREELSLVRSELAKKSEGSRSVTRRT